PDPRNIAYGNTPAGPRVYVANYGTTAGGNGSVAVIGTIFLNGPAIDLAVEPNGTRLYATAQSGSQGTVAVIDTTSIRRVGGVITYARVNSAPVGIAVKPQ